MAASACAGWPRSSHKNPQNRQVGQDVGSSSWSVGSTSYRRNFSGARAEARATAEERDALRGQLEAASHNLELLAERSQAPRQERAAERLGSDEQALLYELRGQHRSPGRAG